MAKAVSLCPFLEDEKLTTNINLTAKAALVIDSQICSSRLEDKKLWRDSPLPSEIPCPDDDIGRGTLCFEPVKSLPRLFRHNASSSTALRSNLYTFALVTELEWQSGHSQIGKVNRTAPLFLSML